MEQSKWNGLAKDWTHEITIQQQERDAQHDPWYKDKQKLEKQLADSNYVNRQLQDRLIKLEDIIIKFQAIGSMIVIIGSQAIGSITIVTNNQVVQSTPMIKNIATPPPTQNTFNIPIDFEAVKNRITIMKINNEVENNRRVIKAGRIYDNMRSPSSEATPYTSRETGQIYQSGGHGASGGNPGDTPDEEDDQSCADRNNRDLCYKGFMLVSPKQIIIPVFSGSAFTQDHTCHSIKQ